MRKAKHFDPKLILDHLTYGVLVFDGTGLLVNMNTAAEEMLEISERQAIGVSVVDLFHTQGHRIEKSFQRVINEAVTFTEHNVVLEMPSAHQATINVSASPIFVRRGDPSGVLIELIKVDRFLRISKEEQLLSQNSVATNLIRGLAHEIKNPLGGLRGAAQLLAKELDDDLTEYTDVIIAESDRLRQLVDRMTGPTKLTHRSEVNIHSVFERVRQLVQAEVSNGITINRDYDPSIPTIHADQDQLIQAVLNVVRNALQAIGDKGEIILSSRIQRQFTIGNHFHKLVVKLDVIDNGPGIPAEMLENIFYPMVTGRVDGTGLGLSIAQTLIQRHGGLIECTSEPGHTVFSIYLPLGGADDE